MQKYIGKRADKAPGNKGQPCGSYGELMPAGQPAALNNIPAVLGAHALAESVAAFAYDIGRSI